MLQIFEHVSAVFLSGVKAMEWREARARSCSLVEDDMGVCGGRQEGGAVDCGGRQGGSFPFGWGRQSGQWTYVDFFSNPGPLGATWSQLVPPACDGLLRVPASI